MASTPLLTIPVLDKIETFVDDIPSNVSAFHGGANDLVTKLTDLLFPRDEDVSEQPKKRGRPKGSKNKPKDSDVHKDVSEQPKKRGRPKGSKNKSNITDQ